ncbi:hypothetical protein MTR67_039249 [Solanum verrucosum]|uniref:Uncharacterized protein n=1 Tax=Solanum verrucosum TaxID=315347 RepID=A0AAF0UHB8_SOLVR|nr:hypothetical protein MTR67_039249 [Solanum verrucosum]
MSVNEYALKFTPSTKYAPTMVANSRIRMSKFMSGESDLVIKQYLTSTLIEDKHISHLMTHANKLKSKSSKKGQNSPRGQRLVIVTFLILDPVDMDILDSCRSSPVKVLLRYRLLSSTKIWCLTLNLKEMVVMDHLLPLAQGVVRNIMSNIWPTQMVDFVEKRVATKLRNLYCKLSRFVSTPVVTPYVAMRFGVGLEILSNSFHVSTPVGDSTVAKRVYRNCPIFISYIVTQVDLVELDMLNFDVILVLIINEFLEVFASDVLGIPPKRDINFNIDLLQDTKPISVPPYRMDPTVTREGIQVDPKKIVVVKKWPRPLSTSDIRSFLGLASYYRRFVEGFSSIASPLTTFTQKKIKFLWLEACEKSFQELKDRLTSTPILALSREFGWFCGVL